MGVVRGVILDESVLLTESDVDQTASTLRPGAESLTRILFLSKIHRGIAYGSGLLDDKVSILKRTADLYSLDCFALNDSGSEAGPGWSNTDDGSVIYLISNKVFSPKLSRYNWLIVVLNVGGESSCHDPNILQIESLEELPLTICRINKKLIGNNAVTVGYTMKPSRVEDFAKRGAFPLCPTQQGLMFVPLMSNLSLSSQLKDVDIVLHKATDEILSIEDNKPTFTQNMRALQKYLDQHPDICVIDPLSYVYPLLDRLEIQQVLLGLVELNTEGKCLIRGAHFSNVDNFDEFDFATGLSEARLSLPCIVKPKVACGVSDAHKMAIVFRLDDFKNLSVPLPAVIQEYVDHSSTLYKFYVLGDKIFYAVKKSIPNADILMKSSSGDELKPLLFDSLKSMPTADSITSNESIDLKLVTDAVDWLRRRLHLTIFGFDVVIQEGTHDHVIVDVNYLPSFKEVPDDIAIPALWEAIRNNFDCRVSK
ncbi:inositol 1,3,4-trisphosphate 5/6-kinase 4 isoform X1 [Vigna radiata var. radiata]|uniref:Inositol 1,3,4-trisphosphate 5/6-kinase 4 isoform X1 n=1 Tax=Vigna radiata var. radiata TaxID=3916 RepID=A0A1S3TM46_VIGRR|nr:inositol 1,3,4-trisphosphate 5/6-kinase 4 isoform X1 [Vigna radiata var. radiata]XP_022635117.1 inositol 1,3,4-trisphosphate 5/6-kinase 4 isoform X1 [Vigna radiata var. radiata]